MRDSSGDFGLSIERMYRIHEGGEDLIEVNILRQLVMRHQAQSTTLMDRLPHRIRGTVEVIGIVELLRERVVRSLVFAQQGHVVVQLRLDGLHCLQILSQYPPVFVKLGRQFFASLLQLVTVVEVLDGLFEADGDEEADDDGGDVDEEVSPGAGGVMCGMDVEHGCWSPVVRVGGREVLSVKGQDCF